MTHHFARALPARPVRWVALGLFGIINAWLALLVLPAGPIDWYLLASLPAAYADGTLYDPGAVPFVWSPVFAVLMVPLAALGWPVWIALHVVALGLIRDRTLITLAGLSVGFWADVILGNTMTFVFVAGVFAMRGSRVGTAAFLVLCLLMPRPVQLPTLAWLMWNRPDWRLPFVAGLTVHAGLVLGTGYANEWLSVLLAVGADQAAQPLNWGPSRLIGSAWLLVGIPLGVVLTWRGYVGLAGLAMSPYVFPQHLIALLWDLRRPDPGRAGS